MKRMKSAYLVSLIGLILIVIGIYGTSYATTYDWSLPQQLDSTGDGAYPTILYSPAGDLRAFYNIEDGTSNNMVVRTRPNGQAIFGDEVSVYPDARTVAIHYDSINPATLDLAVETATSAVVLESLDNGNSWTPVKSYSAKWAIVSAYLPLGFTEDTPDHLRLFYGVATNNISGRKIPMPFYAQRTAGVWEADGSWIGGTFEMSGTYETGNTINIFSGTYPEFGRRNTRNGNIIYFISTGFVANDVDTDNTGRFYILRTDPYATTPVTYSLGLEYSDDLGGPSPAFTLHGIYPMLVAGSTTEFLSPHFAVYGKKMVVAWIHQETPGQPQSIRYVVSVDGGYTHSPVATLVSVDGTKTIQGLDVENYNGKFSIVYSVMDGSAREGVYLTELNLDPPRRPLCRNKCEVSSP